MGSTEEYNGVQKAAILLIALGPEKSAAIFKHLKEDEIEECFETISKYKNIPIKGEVDYERVSLVIVNAIKQEKIKGITFDRM